MVIRIWDLRRLIVPLSYFIEQPFQNWTRESAALMGNVIIYLDYRAPIDIIRKKVEEIAKASRYWDKKVIHTQVTDFKNDTMEVRFLMTAKDAPTAYDLRCEVREKLVDFLQREHPEALPVRRIETGQPPMASGSPGAVSG